MNIRTILLFCGLLPLCLSAATSDVGRRLSTRKPAVQMQKPMAATRHFEKASRAVSRATATADIQGNWRFQLGDYFFDDSSNEIIEVDLQAVFYGDYLFFESADETILPMACLYDEASQTLTFVSGTLGDFYGYGTLAQMPSVYNPSTQKFTVQDIEVTFDSAEGRLVFPENAAMQWWIFDYSGSPMFSIDAYTFIGASKIVKKLNSLFINRDEEENFTLKFSDFSRVEFRDGNIVFDNPERLTIPLVNLKTIHFDEYTETSAIPEISLDPEVKLSYGRDWLSISGLPGPSELRFFSLKGSAVKTVRDYRGEKVDISDLGSGVYVVTAGKHSFKIVK